MSPRLERHVRNPVIRWAKARGILHFRAHMGQGAAAGWPDDWFFLPGGRLYVVEFKRPGGVASKLQEKRIRDLRRLGFDARVFDSSAAAIEHLRLGVGAHNPARES